MNVSERLKCPKTVIRIKDKTIQNADSGSRKANHNQSKELIENQGIALKSSEKSKHYMEMNYLDSYTVQAPSSPPREV